MIHAVVLFLFFLFFGKYAALIPMPTLAAILIVVAYNMIEWQQFRDLLRGPKTDAVVLLATFFLTVLMDLTVAIPVGAVLATFLLMQRISEATEVTQVTDTLLDQDKTQTRTSQNWRCPPAPRWFKFMVRS